ncbi:MAG TPA: hypothetical protein VE779_11455 [Candidatus Angelobacter sp.]|nr:hypothetical protein [Candidatus Angelobacter sp.]
MAGVSIVAAMMWFSPRALHVFTPKAETQTEMQAAQGERMAVAEATIKSLNDRVKSLEESNAKQLDDLAEMKGMLEAIKMILLPIGIAVIVNIAVNMLRKRGNVRTRSTDTEDS